MPVLFLGGILADFIAAAANGILGWKNSCAWQGTLCFYYLCLGSLKFVFLSAALTGVSKVTMMRNAKKAYYLVSWACLLLNIVFGGIIYMMAVDEESSHYPGIVCVLIILYACFMVLFFAVLYWTNGSGKRGPLGNAMGVLGWMDAAVLILMLETVVIDATGARASKAGGVMIAVTGVILWLLLLITALGGIKWGDINLNRK